MTPAELRERLERFAADAARFARPLLRSVESSDVARQLTRSAASAAANHRAAGRGRSLREFTARIGVAVEEIDETVFWLKHLERSGMLSEGIREAHRPLLAESAELAAILGASYRTARQRRDSPPSSPR
jgi:four helix bundle protein